MEQETQGSISKWARETFGEPKDIDTIFKRFLDEVHELQHKIEAHKIYDSRGECADVLIVLYQVATKIGCSLREEVNHKMDINRNRKWMLHGDGTAQHIE